MDKFTALSDPNRRKILELLSQEAFSAGELVERFAISQPAVSQHLKVLKQAELVTCEKRAQKRIYRLSSSGLDEVEQWVQQVRNFWNSSLDALEYELAQSDDEESSP
ncbi:metalloregulator ArsR/SmtB family transcription factor [Pleionea sp. CnH1-48]|uniref:metalloregulator ArsR/SmtB family transcription factor n=1 Tax=Pleionea sp. CnH1-48 TaxID=2954494 RepID=UPI0020983AFB|nr:metalloregulator ArsR/SmtB family transcription factor [Pleionea sp. CnH1-48]MCO7223389.1 metalloregulator ArsR/SmtB family transcription factor [Pleionea sp. CnH1-48]